MEITFQITGDLRMGQVAAAHHFIALLPRCEAADGARRQDHRRSRIRMGLRLQPRFGGGEGDQDLQVRDARPHVHFTVFK